MKQFCFLLTLIIRIFIYFLPYIKIAIDRKLELARCFVWFANELSFQSHITLCEGMILYSSPNAAHTQCPTAVGFMPNPTSQQG